MLSRLSSSALLLCAACQAPLAPTAHEVVDQAVYAGSWDVVWHLPSEVSADGEDDVDPAGLVPLGRLEVSSSGGVAEAGAEAGNEDEAEDERRGAAWATQVTRLLSGEAEQGPERLTLLLHAAELANEANPQPAAPTRYDAQILRVDGRLFLTVQRFAHHDRLDIWTTPLQRTFLMETTDDPGVVWLSMHPKQFVWSPAAYAGTFEFDPDALDDEGGTALVSRFDDVLDFYAARPASEWQRMLRAERLD